MESSSVNGVCRCCASQGAFKDIKTSYHWMGEEEVYSDMLRECFDVNLTSAEQGGICELCITQLRNAANFKKQVLQTEEQFKQHLRSKGYKPVKEESVFDDNDSDDMDNGDDEDYVPEYDVPIKTESESEEKPKKRAAKGASTRTKKSKSSDGDGTVKKSKSSIKKKKRKDEVKVRKKRVITLSEPKEKKLRIVFKKSELGKHQVNIRNILLCSNASPIRRYGGVGYMCCFCPQQFADAALLKTHTLQSHDDSAKSTFMRSQTLPGFVVKLDITDLHCTLCQQPFTNLEDLTSHISTKHGRTFYTDVKSHILPFKFDSDLPKCVVCAHQYNNFKVLLQHMNMHFRNHVCEICGRGFVNKKVFQTHMYRHNTGVFNCSYCTKVFDTRIKKRDHERATHVLMNKRNKCGYCGEKFSDYTKKNDHEVKMHGAKAIVLHCLACNKTFDNQRSLTVHTKYHHLMQKRAPRN